MDQNSPKRKQYSAEFKAKVALEAMSNLRTLAEISSAYGIHAVQITKWKGQLQKNAPELFSDKRKKHIEDKDQLIEELYKQVGQRNVELDWLKKKLDLSPRQKLLLLEKITIFRSFAKPNFWEFHGQRPTMFHVLTLRMKDT